MREQDLLALLRQVGDHGFLVFLVDLRADGHHQDGVVALGAEAVAAHAVAALLGLEVLLVAEVDQRVQAFDGYRPDIAAAPAIAAVRAAILDELLAPERDSAGAAVTGADKDFGLVEELHGWALIWFRRSAPS